MLESREVLWWFG